MKTAVQITTAISTPSAGHRTAKEHRDSSLATLVTLTMALFVGPWAVWISSICQDHGYIGWHLPMGLALWSITPALVVALLLTGGRQALRDVGRRIVKWQVAPRCYLWAVLTPALVATVSVVGAEAAGAHVRLGYLLDARSAAIYFVYGTGLFLLTEEAGWRGALLPRLQQIMTPGRASLLIGGVWAAWHVPLLHVPGEQDQGLQLPVFAVLVIATSILVTALVNAAQGSVLIAALFHAAFDASYAYTGVVGGPRSLMWIATGLTVFAAVGVWIQTRGTLFHEQPRTDPPA
jgi:membrane protease YdiL (CAAX protease family)